MPFDPIEFYRQARRIGKGTREVSLRTAVGRAYYALYLVARERPNVQAEMIAVKARPHPPKGTHETLIDAVKSLDPATGHKLDDLKRLRVVADYHLSPKPAEANWPNNWTTALTIAQSILPKLKTL